MVAVLQHILFSGSASNTLEYAKFMRRSTDVASVASRTLGHLTVREGRHDKALPTTQLRDPDIG